ncbi:CaiB/BaiF CoA transferase family protein [Novosphingobium taihuense]|uniref:Crotonobetainyl-CoA:carnitine CoA-transferase CaiB-like acyl-CoA transferase n=1 Tax=Novosphingobium taihuense TaxID=260085 RepID=A0A7W7EUX1_9SPHN|nr:CoA transferase [Novosphingobium taihuense]MBB4614853.1 crotonobetainyl-CoA:carnitine CoA-transferase CaiB-like acyl-CoA transferase [Novosphingobium taihuense]TWH84705.1 crotonobetainyl-CoA:carnitine CoA-transferase CaiB-like acyl-CoA transferase [Novosphingobium taihuense]
MGKLSGITVLDLTQFFPGPAMTGMMADHGARVIKVEPPAGDPVRGMAPFENGQSVWFANLNRGKESVALDLKSDDGKARLWGLIAQADVFAESFRPGVMARLGFDYATVKAVNPRIVYCSISAFGQDGPLASHAAHDVAVEALAGFLSVNDGPDGKPVIPAVPAADMGAGLTALSAVLMALIGREKTGKGDYLDIAMFDAMLPWCVHMASDAIAGGEAPRSATQRSLGGSAFYQVYETADAKHVVLGGREEKFARNLLTALGREDLLASAMSEAGETQDAAIAFLRETFLTRTRDDWAHWMEEIDVAFAPVLDFREAFDQPHVAHRGLLVESGGRHHIAPPIRFPGETWQPGEVPELSR